MSQQGNNTSEFGDRECAENGVPQQCLTDSPALIASIDRESSQNHDRNGVGHVPLHGLGGTGTSNCPARQAVIPNHDTICTNHIRSSGLGLFTLQCPLLEPPVETLLTAVEGVEVVCYLDWRRGGEDGLGHSQGA